MELIYIIGNRKSVPRLKFAEAELNIRRMGDIAINPLEEILRFNEIDEEGLCSIEEEQEFLQPLFNICSSVYMLNGWTLCKTSITEHDNAIIQGKRVMFQPTRISIEDIIKAAEEVTGIPMHRLKEKSRKASLVEIRRAIFYLAWKYQCDTLVHIAQLFGMDHTTVIHARRTAENLLSSGDARACQVINQIKEKLTA